MFRACELKDQTYKKTRTLHFSDSRILLQSMLSRALCTMPLFRELVDRTLWQTQLRKIKTRETICKYIRKFLVKVHRGRGQDFPKFISCGYLAELGPRQLGLLVLDFPEWAVFQGIFKRANGPLRHSGKRPIKVGKRPINEGKRPINLNG